MFPSIPSGTRHDRGAEVSRWTSPSTRRRATNAILVAVLALLLAWGVAGLFVPESDGGSSARAPQASESADAKPFGELALGVVE